MDDDVRIARLEPWRVEREAPRRDAPRRETRCGAMGTRARDIRTSIDRRGGTKEGKNDARGRVRRGRVAERRRRHRARRARPGFGRAAAPIDRTIDRSIIVIESVHLQRVRVRARSVSRANDKIVLVGRSYAPMLSDINSASVLVSRSRLSSAACAFSVLRMENTDHAKAAIYTRHHHHRQSLSRPHTRPRMDTSSRIIPRIARVSPRLAPARPLRLHPCPSLSLPRSTSPRSSLRDTHYPPIPSHPIHHRSHAPNTSKTRSARIPNRIPPVAPPPCTRSRRG